MMNVKTLPLSTNISSQIKKVLDIYCKQHGIKIRYFIEQAIIDKLEDEIDIEAFELRKNEDTISLDELLKNIS
jgi:hypothetical protein